MQITFIRHTRVDVPKGIVYGQTDVKLAETYRSEFEHIRSELQTKQYDAVYSSPLSRCKLLAENINNCPNIQFDNRLMELNFGNWEGKKWDDIYKTDKSWFDNYLTQACPGGESNIDLMHRCKDFLIHLFEEHNKANILIISHGGPIRAMLATIDKMSAEESFNQKINYGQIIFRSVQNL